MGHNAFGRRAFLRRGGIGPARASGSSPSIRQCPEWPMRDSMGRRGAVRPTAWIWLFSPTHSTSALSGRTWA